LCALGGAQEFLKAAQWGGFFTSGS